MINGTEPYRAADLFDEWFKKLGLGYEKRLVPLAHNWPFDRGFIIDWLGKETVDQYIDSRARDTMVIANFCNDLADFRSEGFPYAKTDLSYMCTTLKIEHPKAHDALQDALATSKLYKELLKRFI
jgi:DNA polymerase III epsilon subunit-like protein